MRVTSNESSDEKSVKSINIWHILLIAFIVLWMSGAYIYLSPKPGIAKVNPPVVVIDSTGMFSLTNLSDSAPTNAIARQTFEVRERYNFGDKVVIKYFYMEAIILERQLGSDIYVVIYKDYNRVLQKIALPKTMLMSPVGGALNPVSLLVD